MGRQIFVLVVIAAMALAAVYLWITQPKSALEPSDATTAETSPEQKQSQNIIERVARHILVNQDEQPYVANITDLAAVRQANPVFYKDAELGDKALIWSDKALIYSPSRDVIVAVMTAPATAVPALPEAATTTTAALEQVTVEIRNGSGIAGLAAKLRDKLKAAGLAVNRIGDARNRVTSTVIVDLTEGQAPNALSKITELAGGSVGSASAGEPASQADILIIIGPAE